MRGLLDALSRSGSPAQNQPWGGQQPHPGDRPSGRSPCGAAPAGRDPEPVTRAVLTASGAPEHGGQPRCQRDAFRKGA